MPTIGGSPPFTPWQAFYWEALMTAVITVAYIVAGSAHHKGIAPLFVGLTISVAGVTIGPISGGFMNPWRAIVPAIFAVSWANCWVWLIGPVVGSIIGVGIVWIFSLVQKFYTDVNTIFITSTERKASLTVRRD